MHVQAGLLNLFDNAVIDCTRVVMDDHIRIQRDGNKQENVLPIDSLLVQLGAKNVDFFWRSLETQVAFPSLLLPLGRLLHRFFSIIFISDKVNHLGSEMVKAFRIEDEHLFQLIARADVNGVLVDVDTGGLRLALALPCREVSAKELIKQSRFADPALSDHADPVDRDLLRLQLVYEIVGLRRRLIDHQLHLFLGVDIEAMKVRRILLLLIVDADHIVSGCLLNF